MKEHTAQQTISRIRLSALLNETVPTTVTLSGEEAARLVAYVDGLLGALAKIVDDEKGLSDAWYVETARRALGTE